jgi:excisionase family DNA binding protein
VKIRKRRRVPRVKSLTEVVAPPPVWLKVGQAAARAQVSARTIYSEAKAGRLRAARVGGRRELRFRAEWIDQWLDDSAPKEQKR